MLVAVDVGNTQTVIGLFQEGSKTPSSLIAHWRVATIADRTTDEHALLLYDLFRIANFDINKISGICFSSSVPEVTAQFRSITSKWFKVPLVIVGPGIKTGMPILYDNPKEVGADRITNAVAAFDRYKGPTIIVDLGTAITFDAVSQNGEYLGGAIFPGIETSTSALFSKAAALRKVELIEPRRVIGKSTVESIQAGTIFGFASLVDGMCERFEAELGSCTIIATGGSAPLVVPYSKKIKHFDPWLTLWGLKLIFEKNS